VIGVGLDAVEVPRFRAALHRTPTLSTRLFSDQERAYAAQRNDPTERLAARFAAKEAVMKALGVGLFAVGFRDIEVVSAPSGEPTVVLSGRAEVLAAERGVTRWLVSLTHTDQSAQAIAIAL
jgi:holo-[acyl-carrier protein] synthase